MGLRPSCIEPPLFIDVASVVCLRHQATDSIVMTSRDPYLRLFLSSGARVKTRNI